MDVLTDILDALRLRGTLYFSTEFTRPWGVLVPDLQRVARFHLMIRGSCWIRVRGSDAVRLDAGDLALVPHGAEHVLADGPESKPRTVDEVVQLTGFDGTGALAYGGPDEGAPTRMICGHLAFEEAFRHPLLDQLPPVLVVRWEAGVQGTPLDDLVQFIATEIREGRPGHEVVTRRLSEVIFVQAIRFWAEHRTDAQGLTAALADPGLASALRAIHAAPQRRWTVESLSREAAMGRTTFAERFRDAVGTTPHDYLTLWRLQRARRLLSESELPMARIATEVGYDSAASFSRAFKREVGRSPGAYRRVRRGGG